MTQNILKHILTLSFVLAVHILCSECFVLMYICVIYACLVPIVIGKGLDILEGELEMIVNCCVGAGN